MMSAKEIKHYQMMEGWQRWSSVTLSGRLFQMVDPAAGKAKTWLNNQLKDVRILELVKHLIKWQQCVVLVGGAGWKEENAASVAVEERDSAKADVTVEAESAQQQQQQQQCDGGIADAVESLSSGSSIELLLDDISDEGLDLGRAEASASEEDAGEKLVDEQERVSSEDGAECLSTTGETAEITAAVEESLVMSSADTVASETTRQSAGEAGSSDIDDAEDEEQVVETERHDDSRQTVQGVEPQQTTVLSSSDVIGADVQPELQQSIVSAMTRYIVNSHCLYAISVLTSMSPLMVA